MNYNWKEHLAPYQEPNLARSLWQVADTLIPYFTIWFLMFLVLDLSYWLEIPLILLAGLLLIRTFIIFHDCGHGSFFRTKKANDAMGTFLSLLVFTPYLHWTREHALHHATSGNLDKRGRGDVWTLTIREYRESPRWKRALYRSIRTPLVMFVFGPVFFMMILHRFSSQGAQKRERLSVYWTNLALILLMTNMGLIFGFKTYLILQTCVVAVAGSIGIWFFYVQHQYEDVYWERSGTWDYTKGALLGSSYYKLPKILQWFSGNIGFHHIHHLNSRIPNYRLESCHKNIPIFQEVKPMTFLASLKSISLRLWDEENKRMVGFSKLRD
jgi:acyl-lipid omega-6 desaturase (Delta-12 desaturase)